MRAFRDEPHQIARLVGIHHPPVDHRPRLPGSVIQHGAHEVVRDAHAVVRVLKEDRRVCRTGERAVVAGVNERPRLLFLLDLAVDELHDVWVVRVQDHHLRRTPRLPSRLDDAGERVVALHERHRSRRRAAARQRLARRSDRRQVGARAGSELEQHALGLGQAEDRLHRVLYRVDETGGALRRLLEPAVEPDGAVEGGFLIDEDVLQLVAERLKVGVTREIPVLPRPFRNRRDDPADELLDGYSRSGVPSWPRKYFDTTMLVACCDQNRGISTSRCSNTTWPRSFPMTAWRSVPLDFVERVRAGVREVSGELQAGNILGLDPFPARYRARSTRDPPFRRRAQRLVAFPSSSEGRLPAPRIAREHFPGIE